MVHSYQDLTVSLDEESEGDPPRRKDPPRLPLSPMCGQRICRSRPLILTLLALSTALVLGAIVLGAKGHLRRSQLRGVQDSLQSLNQTLGKQTAALQKKETDTEVQITEVEERIKQLTKEVHGATTHLRNQMKELRKIHSALNCDLESFKRNQTEQAEVCCPRGWAAFRKSCYWQGGVEKPWPEAQAECNNQDAHLVIINSYEEQQFVSGRARPHYTWIGLTDASGSWKWVDGESYTVQDRDWCPGQPDDWYGHNLGGGEDCAHLHHNGCWNDDHCTRHYAWICEMEIGD